LGRLIGVVRHLKIGLAARCGRGRTVEQRQWNVG
jgi:hypothetical protein